MRIIIGDALSELKKLEAESVHTCVTSPPYWGLRDYGTAKWEGGNEGCDHKKTSQGKPTWGEGSTGTSTLKGKPTNDNHDKEAHYIDVCGKCGATRIDNQLGLEKTPEEYVSRIVEVFREVKRVLRDDGTLWLNLGDSYLAQQGKGFPGTGQVNIPDIDKNASKRVHRPSWLKPKDLVGIPWMVAKALRDPYYIGKIKSEADRIWLAAMIDGEGCMFIHKRKAGQPNGQGYERKNDTYSPGLEISNTHISIIERVMQIAGMGSICHQDKEGCHKNRKQRLYRWNLRSLQCRDIIREVYPYLTAKQHEARLVLGCPSSGEDADKAHRSLINLHNGLDAVIDFPAPESMYEPGWYLRSDIIWSKKNPMPESVKDRPTKSHEYIFLLSKSPKYFFDQDAVREEGAQNKWGKYSNPKYGDKQNLGGKMQSAKDLTRDEYIEKYQMVNIRSVWTIATAPFKGSHFAVFPPKLIEPCIKAGCPEGGTVLDPFAGSGTTGLVARNLGRHAILVELNPKYIDMQLTRVTDLFTQPEVR
jgi:DNA modification methylase